MNSSYSVKALAELQVVDSEVLSLEDTLLDARTRISGDSTIVSLTRRLQQINANMEARTSERRKIESEVNRINERITTVNESLFSGKVTNPRELSAYEDEKAFLEGQRTEQEDGLLEVMVKSDDFQNAHDETKTRLEKAESIRDAEVPKFTQIAEESEARLSELRETRTQIAIDIPRGVLVTYESILKSRKGLAVVAVERNVCQGCRIVLPIGDVTRARNATSPVQCSSCRRIIYII